MSDFWQDVYLAALQRNSSPARAKSIADQAVLDSQARDCPARELKPVYRLRNGAEHFLTIDPAERDGAIANYGYTLEGIAFYAYSVP